MDLEQTKGWPIEHDENKKKHLLKNGIYLDQMKFMCIQAKEDVEKSLHSNVGTANSGMTTKPSSVKTKQSASFAPARTGNRIVRNKKPTPAAPIVMVTILLGRQTAQYTKQKSRGKKPSPVSLPS